MSAVPELIAALEHHAEPGGAEGMARYGIVTRDRVIGVRVGDIRAVARSVGRNHALALELWDWGWYEGRMLACFLADPAQVTPALMDRWAADFDNWATCDTACFHLFDKTPHAFAKVREWAGRDEEFVKRAAFALLASVATHAKKLPDDGFLDFLSLIEAGASDGRNFVKKGVSWALRAMGNRKGLYQPCLALAEILGASSDPAMRWVGKDAFRDLSRQLVRRRAGVADQ
jgi:3-methyladenine DNA glycosylase AlkD